MEKIGNVTKIEKLNITHLRKSAEYYIQESDKLRGRSKTLNYHSDDVGVHFYNDPLAERAEFVNYVDQRETPKKIKRRSRSFDLDRAQRKKKMEEEDKAKKIENAKRLLEAAGDPATRAGRCAYIEKRCPASTASRRMRPRSRPQRRRRRRNSTPTTSMPVMKASRC